MKPVLFVLFILVLLSTSVLAQVTPEEVEEAHSFEENIRSTTWKILGAGTLVIIGITLFAIYGKQYYYKNKQRKRAVFILLVLAILAPTFYLGGSTLFLNVTSETSGPVHWHADYEVWRCGEKLDLIDPTGLSNKVGVAVLHEHNDDRVHVEGVPFIREVASLGRYFHVIGGDLGETSFTYPTNDGIVTVNNGEPCNGNPGEVQVFVYRILNPDDHKEWVYEQVKLAPEDYWSYVMAPYSAVPAGDCIIVEFDVPKESTDKICVTYEVSEQIGDLRGR